MFNSSPQKLSDIAEEGSQTQSNQVEGTNVTDTNSSREETPEISLNQDTETTTFGMDNEGYKTKLTAIKKANRKIEREIEIFSPEVVSLADEATYPMKLQEIKVKFDTAQDSIDDLLDELEEDEVANVEKINAVKILSSALTKKFKENDKAVKDKFLQMISDRDNAKPPDPETEAKIERQKRDILREDRATREAKEKTKLKMRTAIKKFKDLNEEIESLTTVSKMSEQEIRLNMDESLKWEKKTEQFTTLK